MGKTSLTLSTLAEELSVCRLEPSSEIPNWAFQRGFCSVTRTDEELSIVCSSDLVPSSIKAEGPWKCLKVEGPLDFSLTGILSSLALPLAEAGVSIFAISTYDTDYLLVKHSDLTKAKEILQNAGHTITS